MSLSCEPEAWRRWLALHGPALVLFARQWSATLADAEDAVQDGFVRFWKSRNMARGVGYLYACVRTAAIDAGRTGRTRRRQALPAPCDQASQSPFAADQAELAEAVDSALGKLPPEQREVVVMKIWGSLTFIQIGEALRISPNTAASRYRYALARLETELADEVKHE